MKNTILALLLFILSQNIDAQEFVIKGKVTDGTFQEALIGCLVSIEGQPTTKYIMTNIDGMYEIVGSADSVIVFSYLGYESKRIIINGRSEINVTLEEDYYDSDWFDCGEARTTANVFVQTTHSNNTFGYAFDVNANLSYNLCGKSRNLLYNKIKSVTAMGVKVNKTYPKDRFLQTSLYLQYYVGKWFTPGFRLGRGFYLTPYGRIGMYLNTERSAIKSQNLEYGAGLMLHYYNYKYKFVDHFYFVMGYQGYNKLHRYNNFYCGLRFTPPSIPGVLY